MELSLNYKTFLIKNQAMPIEHNQQVILTGRRPQSAIRSRTSQGVNVRATTASNLRESKRMKENSMAVAQVNQQSPRILNNDHNQNQNQNTTTTDYIQTQTSQGGKKSKYLRRPLTQNNHYCAKINSNEDQQKRQSKTNKSSDLQQFQAMPRVKSRISSRQAKSRTKHKEKQQLEHFVHNPTSNQKRGAKKGGESRKASSKNAKNGGLTVRQQSMDILQEWQNNDMKNQNNLRQKSGSKSPEHELTAVPYHKEDFLPHQSTDMFNMSKALASEEDTGTLQQISIFAMNRLASLSQTFSSPDRGDSAAKNSNKYRSKNSKQPTYANHDHPTARNDLEESLNEVLMAEKQQLDMSLENNAQDPQNEELMINIRVPFSKVKKLHQRLQKQQNGAVYSKKARQDQKYSNSPYMLANQLNSRKMTNAAQRRNNCFSAQSTHNGRGGVGGTTLDSDRNETLRKRMDPLLQADPLKQMKLLDKKRAGQKQELNFSPKAFQPSQILTPGTKTTKNQQNNADAILDLDDIQLDFNELQNNVDQQNSIDLDLNKFDDKMQKILANDLANKIQLHESEQILMSQELVACKFCSRKFSQPVLKKHQGVCKNVFGNKRVAFDAKKQRLGINAPIVLLSNGLSDVSPSQFLSRQRSANATPSKQNGRNFLQEKGNLSKQKQLAYSKQNKFSFGAQEIAKKNNQPLIVNGKLQLRNGQGKSLIQKSEQSHRAVTQPKRLQQQHTSQLAKNYQIQNTKGVAGRRESSPSYHKNSVNNRYGNKFNESAIGRVSSKTHRNAQSSQSIRLKQNNTTSAVVSKVQDNQNQSFYQKSGSSKLDARKVQREKQTTFGFQTKDSTTKKQKRLEQQNLTHQTSVETMKSKNETLQQKRQNKRNEYQNQRENTSKTQSLYKHVQCLKSSTERALSTTNENKRVPANAQTPARLQVKQLPLQSSQESLSGPQKQLQLSSKNEKKGQEFSKALKRIIESGKNQQENNGMIFQQEESKIIEPQKVGKSIKERKRSLQQRSSRTGLKKQLKPELIDINEIRKEQREIVPSQKYQKEEISYDNIVLSKERSIGVENNRQARRQSKYGSFASSSKQNPRSKSGGYQNLRSKTTDQGNLKQNSVEIRTFQLDNKARQSFEVGSRNSQLADELAEINKLSKEESQSMLKQMIRYNRQVLGLDSPQNFQNKSLKEDLQDFSLVAQLDSGKAKNKRKSGAEQLNADKREEADFGHLYVDTEESKLSFEGETTTTKRKKQKAVILKGNQLHQQRYESKRETHLQARALPEQSKYGATANQIGERDSLTAREKLRKIIQNQKMARQISRQNKTQRQKSASFRQH